MSDEIKIWEGPSNPLALPPKSSLKQIAERAVQLNQKDKNAIVQAFRSGSYEMASSFVWTRAMATLKKQLASLGTDFVGEMLGRSDITADSPIESVITDTDAVRLAADLGMIASTEAMRLRHALETIQHFAQRTEENEQEEMTQEEAISCLRACIQTVLGQERVSVAIKFADFRKELESKDFSEDDSKISQLANSPYLFQRTTLSVLLSLIKSAKSPTLEHALSNTNVILPLIWKGLRKPEKYQAGETYTYVYSSGKTTAAAGLKKALLKVKGFDFVPETLRSETFTKAATAVLQAHEGWDNFNNERAPMRVLASLGTSIPIPAFPVCMSAALSVRMGNRYGESWIAQDPAESLLKTITSDRWEYYLNECLPGDRRILEKLDDAKPRRRWMTCVVAEYKLAEKEIKDKFVRQLVDASMAAAENFAQEKNVWPIALKILKRSGFYQ